MLYPDEDAFIPLLIPIIIYYKNVLGFTGPIKGVHFAFVHRYGGKGRDTSKKDKVCLVLGQDKETKDRRFEKYTSLIFRRLFNN